jgi:putative endopeptidase
MRFTEQVGATSTVLAAVIVASSCARVGYVGTSVAVKSGIDQASFDKGVRPQDDLFRYVNGGWLSRTEVPADRPVYGAFVELADRSETNVRALVEELGAQPHRTPFTPAQQVGDLFTTFMDEAGAERIGAAPVTRRLAEVDAVRTPAELATLLGKLSMAGLPGAVNGYVEGDVGDPTTNILYLGQAGTALPDRDYYLVNDPKYLEIRAKYVEYLEKIFGLAGRPHAAADARAVLALETKLARMQWTKVESRDAVKTYNKMPVGRFVSDMPGFDWLAWARPQGIEHNTHWVIQQPSFFKAFAAMVPLTRLDDWKAWLASQILNQYAPYLDKAFVDARFAFFGTVLTGQVVIRDRWKRGVQLVNGSLGEAVGRLYVERHFPADAKSRMDALIHNLLEAYRQSITELDWMTPATRTQALAKLDKFTPKVGYPNKWRDYGKLEIISGDLVGNVERANIFESQYQLAKIGRPVDRGEWLMTPQTVNAYYNPPLNEIVFPAAILQPPFFDAAADDAVNYGAIGAVIGHEIGHGFDDQGRRFDGDGRLRDWWSKDDEVEFQRRTRVLVDQFSAFSPAPGLRINGELTVGENIGDLGGLSIAHRAWQIALAGKPSPVIDGLTGDQRFFMGWAQAWRGKAREQYLRMQVVSDPHSWNEFRVNGPVGNIPEFYAAFDVKPGDKLFREPAGRVKIW